MQQCQPSSSLPNPQHPKPEVLNLLAPERIHHRNRRLCRPIPRRQSIHKPPRNLHLRQPRIPILQLQHRNNLLPILANLHQPVDRRVRHEHALPRSRHGRTVRRRPHLRPERTVTGDRDHGDKARVVGGAIALDVRHEPGVVRGETDLRHTVQGPGRRCRLVQGKSGEGFEFGEAVGAVLGAGDARLGAGVSDAGEAEFLGCGDGYGEVAGDCRLAEAGEGSVCVGDLELGNGAGAGVDDEDVLRMGVRVNFHMEWKARMGVSTGLWEPRASGALPMPVMALNSSPPHASSRHGGAAVQGSVEGNWDANEVVGLVVGLEIQGFASGQCITGAAG
ncbi:hypothetical protein N7468_010610 [Penicillium chermesinum]|uniref:Uncharacterized protein n=1 Tax=Penicillium chermesinum TaxID=63820 RepID=A0A9W9N811_9EURO|nr:uncharacterized protein N7468_010610 [Penicillium chermesinum]KAJ5214931.1 hypothetical protein N7468_010610 [Penicillium chermesinum]